MSTQITITPDFENAKEFAPIKPGTYMARISDAEVKTSKSGDAYVNWKWTIYGATGEYADANGREVRGFTMAAGKAAGQLKTLIKAVHGDVPVAGQQFDVTALYGKEAQIVVKQQKDRETGELTDWVEVAAVKPITQ